MRISDFQAIIERTYGEKDRQRGLAATFLWFIEEVGELARALHRDKRGSLSGEFADCLAWLATLANLAEVDLEKAAAKYQSGCYKCHSTPCRCLEPRNRLVASAKIGKDAIARERAGED